MQVEKLGRHTLIHGNASSDDVKNRYQQYIRKHNSDKIVEKEEL